VRFSRKTGLSALNTAWIVAFAVVASGCSKPASEAAAPKRVDDPGRVAGIAAAANPGKLGAAEGAAAAADEKMLAGFCDKYFIAPMPAKGATAAQGDFAGGPAATAIGGAHMGTGGWRWVNFWATWCKPCLEEMPMLGRWRDALVKEGIDFTLELWSVDEDNDKLKAALAAGVPGPVWQVESADKLGDWLQSYGVDREAVLPIQVLVAPNGQIRCLRLGSVRPADYAIVKQLLR
jgi:thiol-disulfide isomerase/thioredoxin